MAIKFYTDKYYAFDNFSAHAVEYGGKIYPTSEHAYQAANGSKAKALARERLEEVGYSIEVVTTPPL